MGDRANIIVKTKGNPDLFLYSHYDGWKIHIITKVALARGRDRWDDEQYLARILFCEMVRDDLDGTSGYGISTFEGDGGNDIVVNIETQTVTWKDKTYSFEGFTGKDFPDDEPSEQ